MYKMAREHLANSLQELVDEELKKFKSKLTYVELKKKIKNIPRGDIKKVSNHEDLAEILVNHYGSWNAVKVTMKILKKIHQRHVAEKLLYDIKENDKKNKKEEDDETDDDDDDDETDEESSDDDDDDDDDDDNDDDDDDK